MPDREKVIKGIRCRLELKCNECPYTYDDDVCDDCDSLFRDVLELLKEKEEEIENLKQTCQSMTEGAYLLKEQDVKIGKWIPVTNGRGGMECNICHDYAPSYQSGAEYLSKHCPNCGAKMEGR